MDARRTPWGTIVGIVALCLAFAAMYVPVVMVFAYSFQESRLSSVWSSFSLNSYAALWQNQRLWAALRTSLKIGAFVSTTSVVLGGLAALGLHQWRRRPRAVAQGLFGLPLVVPDIIIAISLAIFFNAVRAPMGVTTVVLAQVSFGLSYAFVVVSAAVKDLDPNVHAAALDCGATRWKAFWLVTSPLLAPSLVVAWMLVFSLSFDDFLVTFFTKGPGNDTLPIYVYSQMRFGVKPETNAIFVVLFVATTAAMLVATRLRARASRSRSTAM